MSDKKQEIIKKMTDIEIYPDVVGLQNVDKNSYNTIPLTDIVALGTAFLPIIETVKNYMASSNISNQMLYSVTFPKGCHLASFHDGSGKLGTVLNSNNQIVGQARINAVQGSGAVIKCNPYMIVVAAVIMCVTKKLDEIVKTQNDILAFLEQKERARLIGNLNYLSDIINNYKYNWDNEQYRGSYHIKVLDIKQDSEASIELYRAQINNLFENLRLLHINRDVKEKKNKLNAYLGDYQIAVYLYAYSSYVDVLMLENFNEEYLNHVISKIEKLAIEYREFFSDKSAKLEKFAKDSVLSNVIRGTGKVSKFLGKSANNIPALKDKIDKRLVKNGENLQEIDEERNSAISKEIAVRRSVDISVFLDNLKTIRHLYNNQLCFLFDSENIYFEENAVTVEKSNTEK